MSTEEIIHDLYNVIDLKEIIKILAMDPESNAAIYAMIERVFNILLPISFTFAGAFLMISFLGKAALFKMNNYENIVKMFLFFTLGKAILTQSFELMHWAYQIVAEMIADVGIAPSTMTNSADMAAMIAEVEEMGMIDKIMFKIQSLPIGIVSVLINKAILVIAYGRLIEIYVCLAVASLPFSTIVSEQHCHIAKKFFHGFVAVCLQGLVMLLSCVIFSGLSAQFRAPGAANESLMGGAWGFLMASLVLLFVLVKSGSWAKQIVGLM
ncbi:MAG: CD0415/CD1112 family protein [Eubacteriales bacterium]|nr:CD0415/CD1112 family protein [Eubacteriales bacterium]MDD3350014.1 CD0415/CD1112 family protein [Eubacteriales bacterium]